MKKIVFISCLLLAQFAIAQNFYAETKAAKKWVKKQFRKLSKDERIAQLMIIRAHSNLGQKHIDEVTNLITKYNVGGLCFFQGGPIRQALLTNTYQSMAKTPLMICIDGEWGLGMRLDSVINYPRQLMMGATTDAQLIYAFGKAVGNQCKRLGIHVNYAPDIDVNNNPNNPVINDRSFGEDKYKVALYGVQYMKGMQDVNVMACAKHFPGHGDVAVDSHYDLPIITKTKQQLDSLELYPFRELIKAGVGSMMIAHLSIPVIDSTPNLASSLSAKNINGLLKEELGYKGITFTDGLGMQGITKFFPSGEASVQALIAGNDMLCLPENVAEAIAKTKEAIKAGKLSWDDINARVKKVLLAKYNLGLHQPQIIDTTNLLADLNKETQAIKNTLSENAITVLQTNGSVAFPLTAAKKIAYISIGAASENSITALMKTQLKANVFLYGAKASIGNQLMDDKNPTVVVDKADKASADILLSTISSGNYDAIVVGMHNYSRRPANNFGINDATIYLLSELNKNKHAVSIFFGNPYAMKFACNAPNLVAMYEDDATTQTAAFNWLIGKLSAKGKLPVTVCDNLKFGDGITYHSYFQKKNSNGIAIPAIDSIAVAAIAKQAMPGCVVLAAHKGQIIYHKAFGTTTYTSNVAVKESDVFDLASVTKISATTVAVMKLYEEGKLQLDKTIGDYLPWVNGSDKAALTVRNILLHQAGLNPFIPFYKAVIDTVTGNPLPTYFSTNKSENFPTEVATDLYLVNNYVNTLHQKILDSKLTAPNKYVYSDNDFIFLGRIVEAITGKPLNEYVAETFYKPLGMQTTGYLPLQKMPVSAIIPTEQENHFRKQLLWGYVHDEGAAMFGGVAGHAGLFSNAYDLAQFYQLLLNGGELNGIKLLQKSTIDLFTAYNSNVSRRGLGFDKPEKDNATRKEPYPSKFASAKTYGHTGFTGTCVWVDPDKELIYIFLSNRVNPTRNNNKLSSLNVRSSIQDAIYNAIQ